MMHHLTDLDELLERVHNKLVKEYVIESVVSYRSGAYRASVSLTWIAICVDLIEKIKDLSNSGDKKADIYNNKLNEITASSSGQDRKWKMMEFENGLLDIAKEFEFINSYEFEQLQEIKRDRNYSVHPSFQKDGRYISINPETARSHIVKACNILFIHPVTQGKAIEEDLFNMVIGDTFEGDVGSAKKILSDPKYLGRARKSLLSNFTKRLLKKVINFSKVDDVFDVKTMKKVCAALSANYSINEKITSEAIKDFMYNRIGEDGIKSLLFILNECRFIETYLNQETRLRLFNVIKNLSSEEVFLLNVPKISDNNNLIKKELLDWVKNADKLSLYHVIENSSSSTLKNYAIKMFLESSNFDDAIKNGDILLKYCEFFDSNDVKKILDGSIKNDNKYFGGRNQILGAGRINEFFKNLFSETAGYRNEEIWREFIKEIVDTYPSLDGLGLSDFIDDYIPF